MALPFIIAGAAAVAAAVGGKKAYDGYQKKSEADEILDGSKNRYDKRENEIKVLNKVSEQKLEQLGTLELNIGKSFGEFKKISDELLKQLKRKDNKDLTLSIPKFKIDKIEEYSFSTVEFLGTAVASGAAGAVASFAVYSGVMGFAAASTGTPIAALSGVAAYNATMAAIGGGSLAAGGWGMAGGAMVLGAAAIAPMIAIGGFAYDNYAEKALVKAKKTRCEIDTAIIKMNLIDKHLSNTNNYVDKIYTSLEKINQTFNEYFSALKEIHEKIVVLGGWQAISDMREKSLRIINNGYLLAAIMTDIITTPLFKIKKVSEDGIIEVEKDSDGFNIFNQEVLDNVLINKEKEYKDFILGV
ncbi:chemotaxis protein [Gilliamella sp. ESL0250]|uniref:chemotaxis protein n=1 Tax=Gilliamella sp. ESL0250 TaxID=2705036 RepID=UPI00157FCB00|nr:chemotaxis protein [Gilliamella sp. ESL0250]NUF50531.1 chemotaxis protein [Gilliamella sp. ESL0250]